MQYKEQAKEEREADQIKLDRLNQTKENIAKMADFADNLKELCAQVVPDLDEHRDNYIDVLISFLILDQKRGGAGSVNRVAKY